MKKKKVLFLIAAGILVLSASYVTNKNTVSPNTFLASASNQKQESTDLSSNQKKESKGLSSNQKQGSTDSSSTPKGKYDISDLTFLEGLDVNCAPTHIVDTGDGAFLVTDSQSKKVWRIEDGEITAFAGADSVANLYEIPMGGYNDGAKDEALFGEPYAIVPFKDGWAVSDPDNAAVRLITGDVVQTINPKTDETDFSFEAPRGLAVDSSGNLYISDTEKGDIYVLSASGELQTLLTDLEKPMGLCWSDDVLYIAETGENRIIQYADGNLSVLAGSGKAAFADGEAKEASFSSPQSIAVDEDGVVYVADTVNSAIRYIQSGEVKTLFARNKDEMSASLVSPSGLFLQQDKLYICDPFARQIYIYEQ